MKRIFTALILLTTTSALTAQSDSTGKWYDNISLQGYVQTQFNWTNHIDSASLHSYSAGTFDRFNTNKFMVRRGRIQMFYEKGFASSSISFDVTERGFDVKDAWLNLQDPWMNAFSVKTGVFAVPFGHEIELSSQDRESPERSRVIQHLFPSIRDIGAGFQFQMPEESGLHFLKFNGGIYHGTGANYEADNEKDFSTRIMIDKPLKSDMFNFSLAFSSYHGKVNHLYDIDGATANYHYVWAMKDTMMNNGIEDTTYTIMYPLLDQVSLDSILNDTINPQTTGTFSNSFKRTYFDISAQIDLDLKVGGKSLGKTTIRGEYVWGDQISQEGSLGNPYTWDSESPAGPFQSVTWPKYDSPQPYNPASVGYRTKPSHTFIRRFQGMYFYIDQQIGETGHHLVYKYDSYDPNLDVEGTDITMTLYRSDSSVVGGSGLSTADVKFTTHGFGYRYVTKKNLSFMIYYENPRNELTDIDPYASNQINFGKYPHTGFLEEIKDDVFTFRIQYIF